MTDLVQIISTGSSGNAVLYGGRVLIDTGVPFNKLKPFYNNIQLVLSTHRHGDHINRSTVRKLAELRPSIRFACCEWMLPWFEGIKNVDVLLIGQLYNYGNIQVSPVKLFHDVPNCGYRLVIDGKKILHCTDTVTLEGIEATGYDYYCLETNYDKDKIIQVINAKHARGEYAHEVGSLNSHLSIQQAHDFYMRNKGEHSEFIPLHQSKTAL